MFGFAAVLVADGHVPVALEHNINERGRPETLRQAIQRALEELDCLSILSLLVESDSGQEIAAGKLDPGCYWEVRLSLEVQAHAV